MSNCQDVKHTDCVTKCTRDRITTLFLLQLARYIADGFEQRFTAVRRLRDVIQGLYESQSMI